MWYIVLFFIFGAILGSFINAVSDRAADGISIWGRSQCPKCQHQLGALDLVPILSYILLGGKCRYCSKKISWQYLVVELLSGIAAVSMLFYFGLLGDSGFEFSVIGLSLYSVLRIVLILSISSILVLLALHDYKTGYILSGYVYAGAILAIIMHFANHNFVISCNIYSQYLYGALIGSGLFMSLYIGSRGKWMGAGDIEVGGLIGLILGWQGSLVALYFAFIVGSIFGISKIINKKLTMKSEMPFGPFLVSGAFFAMLFGRQIIGMYAKIFLGY